MLKKSLLTAFILAVTVTTAGAESDNGTLKAQQIDQMAFELALDSLWTSCEASGAETQSAALFDSPSSQLLSSQLDGETAVNTTFLFGSWGPRRCLMCTSWGWCVTVPC